MLRGRAALRATRIGRQKIPADLCSPGFLFSPGVRLQRSLDKEN